ncbi:MAG: hypothetical protein LBV75_01555 [Paludibacter sp.]|jgi:hypothetical protein|nr:hypothetical protein [Paludibacter sp.]
MSGFNITDERKILLAKDIADYCSNWLEDKSLTHSYEENIKAIESYGISFEKPDDKLVKAAVRHLISVVNPWNRDVVPEILQDCLIFTKEEAIYYYENQYN